MTLLHSASWQAALLPALAAVCLQYVREAVPHIHRLPAAGIVDAVRIAGIPDNEPLPPVAAASALFLSPFSRLQRRQVLIRKTMRQVRKQVCDCRNMGGPF